MGVSSSESHDLTAFYELLTASFGVLSQNTGFYPSLDRIVETTLRPLNLGPGGGSYNEPISCLQRQQIPEQPPSDQIQDIAGFQIRSSFFWPFPLARLTCSINSTTIWTVWDMFLG